MDKEQGALDAEITEKIVGEYAKAAFCNVCDFYEIKDGVLTVKPLEKIPDSAAGAIAGLKQTKDGVELKFYDKYKALEAIAKIMGIPENGNGNASEAEESALRITVNHCVPRPQEQGTENDGQRNGGDTNNDNAEL